MAGHAALTHPTTFLYQLSLNPFREQIACIHSYRRDGINSPKIKIWNFENKSDQISYKMAQK
jgi:hypothetical protein